MWKSKNRYVAMALVAVCTLTGCTSNVTPDSNNQEKAPLVNKSGLPIVNEPITVKVMYPRSPLHGDFEKMWFTKELARKTNITLKFEAVESAGWEEKKRLAFASGDLPDVFLSGLTSNDENLYGSQGLLLPLRDLIDKHAPLTKSLLEKFPDVKRTFTFSDGNMYVLPVFNESEREFVPIRPVINRKWLDTLKLQMPANLDELYNVLKAFKEKDPNGNGKADEIPMSGLFKGNSKMVVLAALGFASAQHDVKNNKYVYVPMDAGYKEYLIYMNRLYREGLLDKEYFTQTREQMLAKEAELRFGLNADGAVNYNLKGDEYLQYEMIPPLTSSINSTKTWGKQQPYTRFGTFAITKNAKNPEALVRLLDFLYTLEGSIMVRGGPEFGKWDGKGGYEYTTVNGVKTWTVHYDGYNSFANFRYQQTPMNLPMFIDKELFTYINYNDPKGRWLDEQIAKSKMLDAARLAYPEVKFTLQEQEKIAAFIDLDRYVEEAEAKFIIGEIPFSQWDSYLDNLKKMGADEMSKIRQAAYDRWNNVK